jgi:hypothetical protein
MKELTALVNKPGLLFVKIVNAFTMKMLRNTGTVNEA